MSDVVMDQTGDTSERNRSGDRPGVAASQEFGRAARAFPAFAIFASLGYFLSIGFNVAPFVYYPEAGELYWSPPAVALGPPMFWYGWIINGAALGAVGSGLACLLPESIGKALVGRWSWLVWCVPATFIAATLYFLRSFF